MTLRDAAVGSTVVVSKITGDPAYKRRIMDMGITKGSEVYIRKVAPLGGTCYLRLPQRVLRRIYFPERKRNERKNG